MLNFLIFFFHCDYVYDVYWLTNICEICYPKFLGEANWSLCAILLIDINEFYLLLLVIFVSLFGDMLGMMNNFCYLADMWVSSLLFI
jgi:hypothetical protein